MPYPITTAQVQQYTSNVRLLLQQTGSRLRDCVESGAYVGKSAEIVEQFGQAEPTWNVTRFGDTPLIAVPQDRRWVAPQDADWATLIDKQDRLRLLIDPAGAYTMAGAAAMGRAQDDAIIQGFFGNNYTGEIYGNTSTGLLSAYGGGSQVIAANVGASAATGLNVAKMRAARQMLMAAEVDLEADPCYIAVTAKQHDNLLAETQIINLDYNDRPVLIDGRIQRFLGFNFVHSERIPGGAKFNVARNPALAGAYTTNSQWLVPFWNRKGVHLGIWNDMETTVDRRPDKRNAWQIYITMTLGATRTEELRCGYIICN